jgi:hypothetical protein
MNDTKSNDTEISRTRFVLGACLFVGGFLSPLLIPLVTQSSLPSAWKTILSTGLVAGLPEIGMLAAVAVLGKQGFAQLKSALFAILKKHTAPSTVSLARYRLGLVMFCVPLALGFMDPYVTYIAPTFGTRPIGLVMLVDCVFALSFLVLGAGFWDKIHGLFIHSQN